MIKKLIIISLILATLCLVAWTHIERASGDALYTSVDDIPNNRVGLLLGTSPRLTDGRHNLFFLHRIQAATELYRSSKIDYILVSGDNRHASYNEPEEMKQALMKEAIPEDRIILDYAGLRTLDSVIRAREVFGQDSITIISQEFQVRRGLFLAEHHGIDALGYAADGVSFRIAPRVYIREVGARIKAMLDVLLDTRPKFLGPPVSIGLLSGATSGTLEAWEYTTKTMTMVSKPTLLISISK